jgi:hypothetical protein
MRSFNVRANTHTRARVHTHTHIRTSKHELNVKRNEVHDFLSAKLRAYYFVKRKNYCIRLNFKISIVTRFRSILNLTSFTDSF